MRCLVWLYVSVMSVMSVWVHSAHASTTLNAQELIIPDEAQRAQRLITIEDMAAVRSIERLEVSLDGRQYTIFVRQGDPQANEYRSAWFIGHVEGGKLVYAGDGGELQPGRGGEIEVPDVRWSPDGQWIAYTRRYHGEVQLWRSKVDGSAQEQVTHNAADVREFCWSEDGRALYFTVVASRNELRADDEAKERAGYQYDEDLYGVGEFLYPVPPRRSGPAVETAPAVWVATLKDHRERLGGEPERGAFELAQRRHIVGRDSFQNALDNMSVPGVKSVDGALAWLMRSRANSLHSRLMAALPSRNSQPIACAATECSGFIIRVWWSEDGKRVFFLRKDGLGSGQYGGSGGRGIYAWSPSAGALSTILYTFDYFRECSPTVGNRLTCIRETPTSPPHVVAINLASGTVQIIADINPEFRSIRLGRADRFEWDTPKFPWSEPGGKLHGMYATRAFGYILYPPDFDPTKKYPVIIDPYVATGFNSSAGGEHALQVYAANGFIVLNTQFPQADENASSLFGAGVMKQLYSAELDFPHMTMYAESTVRALEVATARGFIDERRVGIGGVSHGTFIPLYILQKHDLIAAISVSSQAWGVHDCYSASSKGRESVGEWITQLGCEKQEYWSRIDVTDHIDTIEAPILMNLSAAETLGMTRLLRHLADANKPYDAYVFPKEFHFKWQPAHLQVIQNRNLDWFRFWLQGYEDPSPAKVKQYVHWRQLRVQHDADLVRGAG